MNKELSNYFCGVGWFILSLTSSTLNDIIAKYAGSSLPSSEVSFFRFLFSSLTLIPFILYYGKDALKTSNPLLHFSRGLLLFIGITAWTYGLSITPVTTGTVLSFATPLFTLILAVFFLEEKIFWQRWLATIVGFVGIVITINPNSNDFNIGSLIFVGATVAFATLDILNKKFVIKESMISMLFYSALVTACLSAPGAIMNWQTPSSFELFLLLILGMSANLILFLLLKAYNLIEDTASVPYRYFELIFSAIAAFLVFNELPERSTIYGALIIIPATFFVVHSEKQRISKENNM